jgi:2-methylcitrate dehydratase PrpD
MAGQIQATRRFADFISDLSFDSIPVEVIEEAKKDLLELLSFSFARYNSPAERVIKSYVLGLKGARESTVWLRNGEKIPAPSASLANGSLSGSGSRFAFGHFAGPIHSAAIATAELKQAGGKELLTSVIAGYEVCLRIGKGIQPPLVLNNFQPCGTLGALGATAASAKALGLNGEKMINAIGLGGVQASGLMEYGKYLTDDLFFMSGRAAQSGVIAAFLAERGLTAPPTIIEGDMGFCKAMADSCDYDKMFEGLGEKFEITSIYHVPYYPVCRHIHSAMDAMYQIMLEHPFSADELEEVLVRTYEVFVHLGNSYKPVIEEGKLAPGLSCPLTLALIISRGCLTYEEYYNTDWSDRKLLSLANKIKMKVDPELDDLQKSRSGARGSIVEVRLKNGAKHIARVDYAKGEPENPMSFREISDIFQMNARDHIHQKRIEEIVDTVKDLDKLVEISDLCNQLKVQ